MLRYHYDSCDSACCLSYNSTVSNYQETTCHNHDLLQAYNLDNIDNIDNIDYIDNIYEISYSDYSSNIDNIRMAVI